MSARVMSLIVLAWSEAVSGSTPALDSDLGSDTDTVLISSSAAGCVSCEAGSTTAIVAVLFSVSGCCAATGASPHASLSSSSKFVLTGISFCSLTDSLE